MTTFDPFADPNDPASLPPGLGDAISRAFGGEGEPPAEPAPTETPADPSQTVEPADPAAAPVDVPRSEEGEGGGGPSPAAVPDSTSPAAPEPGGATDFVPPAEADVLPDGAEPKFQLVDDTTPPADPTATPPPDPSAPYQFDPAGQVDINRVVENYMGRPATYDDSKALLELFDFSARLQSLPPDAQQIIGRIVEAGGIPQDQPPTSAPVPSQPPASQTAADPWDDPSSPPPVDPALQARIDALEAQQAQAEMARQQQFAQWVGQEQSAAVNEFAQQVHAQAGIALTGEDLVVIEQRAMQSGMFALEMQRTGGNDPRGSWKRTLEATINNDPAFRQRVLDAQVEARVRDREAELARQQRAASVSAGGGTVPQPATSKRPKDMVEAVSGMAADLEALGQAGG